MSARAIWKGVISLPSIEIPVKFYSAVSDRRVHFRLLHAVDKTPVRQQMVRADKDEPVAAENLQKGYQAEDGSFVVLTAEDFEALTPKPSRDIEILRFVEPAAIDLQWYDRPYFLGSDGQDTRLVSFAAALRKTEKVAIARWVMRHKTYIGALHPHDNNLLMMTMRFADQVVLASSLPRPTGGEPSSKELALAEQLVSTLHETFDPSRFEDDYRQKIEELLARKATGRELELPAPRLKRVETSLEDALKASLNHGNSKKKKRKVA